MAGGKIKPEGFTNDYLYVWNAEVAVNLRRNRRIMGAMLGTSFGFEQGNCDLDLPLQLSPYEADMALDQGWLRLEDVIPPERTTLATHAADGGTSDAEETPHWKALVLRGDEYTVAMQCPVEGAAIHSSTAQHGLPDGEAALRLRRLHIVFRDLHGRGFYVTGGHKFGGDFLGYQGDPCLFHAQYCVRVQHDMGLRSNVLLAAARRGALGAKKHFLIAEVVFPEGDSAAAPGQSDPETEEPYVMYHNVEQNGSLGPTQNVLLTPGDYNSKLFRVCS